jgi:hypothetical protein
MHYSHLLPGIRFAKPFRALLPLPTSSPSCPSFSHDSNDHLVSQVYPLSGKK